MKRRCSSGFSLIEILAVLAVIAVAFSLTMVSIGGDSASKRFTKQVDQFIGYADMASDFAMIKGETWGFVITPPEWQKDPETKGYRFSLQRLEQQYDDDLKIVGSTWVAVKDAKDIEIPTEIDINVIIEDHHWDFEKAPEQITPLIIFYSSGDITPFELELVTESGFNQSQHIELNEWGEVVWRERQEMLEAYEEYHEE